MLREKLDNLDAKSRFHQYFSSDERVQIINGVIQVTRDPTVFYILLSYIQLDFAWEMIEDVELDIKARDELDFWGIPMPPTRNMLELQKVFDVEPEKAHYKSLWQWKQ